MRTRHISSSDPVLPPLDDARGKSQHQPVLLHEVMQALDVQPGDTVVDATLGGAGHAEALLKGLGGNGLFIGFDADPAAIERARARLSASRARMYFVHGNFRHIVNELATLGIGSITKTLFDLGWSSFQLNSQRGFSFLADEPLLMTYGDGDDAVVTAATVVNTWSEQTLADIIFGFGGERYSRRIASAIVERRRHRPFATSGDLAKTIASAVPKAYKRARIHPATRTFQALRIAVNDELGALAHGLEAAWKLTVPGGRIAVIAFHSLEDRIVKRAFAERVRAREGRLIFKKPVIPSIDEIRSNPRARSAKLRVIEKISHESKNTKDK
ncbi:16S rRNA (cytosine(1402)-N(4))-methyltransferase RsmH [Candidatus Kaiserbacteria bacterium]|nr:16S rRNA (cytosine(1402)-N(4))-methyltransferase RsmH [Candidatus Kaiserbacteria bacterium]